MLPTFTSAFGNAASRQHAHGTAAAELVDRARVQVARLIGATAAEIVFTSGASESINLAIKGAVDASPGDSRHVVTTSIEHKAVLDSCQALEQQGVRVSYLPVSPDGIVRVEDVVSAIEPDTVLVSVMYANNEIGTIQPVGAIGALCKERGVLFHCDAVQAVPHLPCDVGALGLDLLSLSAHKMYGPKGIGALYVRRKSPHVRLSPLIHGGGHERGLRSGTLNVSGAVGLGVACEIVSSTREEESIRLVSLRNELLELISAALPDVTVNGSLTERLPNNLNLGFPGLRSDAILRRLEGVSVSSGSACSSASVDDSYVLRSLGGDRADQASLRIGLGRFNTRREVGTAAERIVAAVHGAHSGPADGGDGCDVGCA